LSAEAPEKLKETDKLTIIGYSFRDEHICGAGTNGCLVNRRQSWAGGNLAGLGIAGGVRFWLNWLLITFESR
jgi:hypothetical protein